MNEKLKKYLENCSPADVDQSTLDDLRTSMEEAVPEIAENIRLREELAAQLRIAPSRPSQPNPDTEN